MATEIILLDGRNITTLRELLARGLKAVFVGINPAQVSVKAGHYYQGKHGKRFWKRLQDYKIAGSLPVGAEDDEAFRQGYGFAGLVRRPAKSAHDLTKDERKKGADDLLLRLGRLGDRPLIIFVYADAAEAAEDLLLTNGYRTFRMPGPYDDAGKVDQVMSRLREELRKGEESPRVEIIRQEKVAASRLLKNL